MSNEQEEKIKDIKIYIHDYISESFDEDGYTQYEISEEEEEFFNNIETVLNMLKEKDEEIEKKDKIIYEMIDSFIDLGFEFEYCNNDDRCINDCDKCIKQYFEKLAKEKGE